MAKLDEIAKFTKESNKLIAKSPYSKNIEKLLAMPEFGRVPYDGDITKLYYKQPSNCHGTLFYVLGLGNLNFPRFADKKIMNRFLNENCESGKEENGIVTFSSLKRGFQHCGLYLGKAAGKDTIFHQPNTGEEYCVEPVTNYLIFYPEADSIVFFKFKDKKNLWVPSYLNEKD